MPVPNTIADLNQAAASNYPLGTDTVGPNLDDYLRAGFAFTRQLFDGSAFLLGSVSGTDTITATCPVPFTAYVAGQTFRFVAAGANTTNAVTLNVNGLGAKSITKFGTTALIPGDIAAGSVVQVTYDGTQFQIDNVAASGAHGQCRLAFVSTTQIRLSRFNGSGLIINGTTQQIPSGGVTYTISGLAASTLYYVYAYMNAGVMTLELSTTGRTTAANGVEVKVGDSTRTFVGLVRTTAATLFNDFQTQRFVRSWFNDPGIDGLAWFSAGRATTSTVFVEINTEIRIEFLTFADDLIWFGGSGISTSNVNSQLNSTVGAIDAGAEIGTYSMGYYVGTSGGVPFSFCKAKKILGEGYHYATLLGKVSAGTGTWSGGAASPSTPDICAITIGARR
ncbi:hypothetical protein [Cupriavidus campinensis]|uniref:Ubiquitin-activating enzyme E1 FCCH domain-containing protein n=1 Tax=Cupriavidus campinensis TaxID=151783 RepID=A0ABY3EKG5_9BURK|nr:hypothetical protein [Cupriavidus campinensis]TSP11431.1 hypothetical protein FGG12_17490 [Cupriavidus campinensis]